MGSAGFGSLEFVGSEESVGCLEFEEEESLECLVWEMEEHQTEEAEKFGGEEDHWEVEEFGGEEEH
jgi:hypothetical protein